MKNNSIKKTYDDLLRDSRSFAGKRGASSRWKDHVKKPTTHIRIYQDDYDKLVSMVGKFPSVYSITSAVAYAVDRVCSRRCMACKKP